MRALTQKNATGAGFTLVEILIGVLVMAGILSGAYMCLHAGFKSRKSVEMHTDVIQTARVALTLMTADLRSTDRLSDEFEFVGMDRELGDMEADNIDFATRNWTPQRPGESDQCEISYYVDKNRKTGEFGLWRRRDPTLDLDPLDGGFKEEIAQGLKGLKFEYYDGFSWYDTWGKQTQRLVEETEKSLLQRNLFGLPDAVRITLRLGPASAKRENRRLDENKLPPPLVFQTVVFLPLAEKARRAAFPATTDWDMDGETTDETQEEASPSGSGEGEINVEENAIQFDF